MLFQFYDHQADGYEMDPRPVPAFYACYLLRSTVRHASLYIGSTPNPKRRLAQHNGLVKGGAFQTSKKTLRPWEMVCLVTGFPSNIAALQFEWTWQNPHLTRRIQEDQRITLRDTVTKLSKSGKVTKRPARPRMSLKDRLANLHLLLQVPSFARWPLSVRFYSADVYKTWIKYVEVADKSLGNDVKICFGSQPHSEPAGKVKPTVNPSVSEIDVTYDRYKTHLDKSAFILADDEDITCDVCHGQIQTPGHIALTCSHTDCRSASHLLCLSKKFLTDEDSQELIPQRGVCPRCKTELQWLDLVTEFSLRIRGEKEVAHIMRRRRPRKAKDATIPQTFAGSMNDEPNDASEDDGHETLCVDDILDEPLRNEAVDNEFYDLDDFDDNSSIASNTTSRSLRPHHQNDTQLSFKDPPGLTLVIEDSEYDSADTLD